MNIIKKLPPHLIAQIAAGEVIERPSYAIKELIDNAIDAKATSIGITLEKSGLKKIIITDNGTGMTKENLLLSYKIHTTSKIYDQESLKAIKSLGFRGEALASIAAVSHLTIKSRPKNQISGYQVEIRDGMLFSESIVGMPEGTIVEIENIFSTTPARKKFLKSEITEMRHIIEVIESFAIAYPYIQFKLTHNQKILFDFPATNDRYQRITNILNSQLSEALIPVEREDSYVRISGFITHPKVASQSSSKSILFVNNRKISDKLVTLAVKDGYVNVLSQNVQPISILFLEIPFELIDVNVHPRKEQIAFYNPDSVYHSIKNLIQEELAKQNITFGNASFVKDPITSLLTGTQLKKAVSSWQPRANKLVIDYKTVTQFHNLYLLVQIKNGFLYIDQHAAHERILYEQFKKEFLSKRTKSVKLSHPISLQLSLSQELLLKEFKKEFLKIGLVIDEKEKVIKEIPLLFKDRNLKKLLDEMFENLSEKNSISDLDQISNKIIQFLACKQAIKAGDPLTKTEAIALIKKLEKTENNITCPHGRPTKYIFALSEMHKLFKRGA